MRPPRLSRDGAQGWESSPSLGVFRLRLGEMKPQRTATALGSRGNYLSRTAGGGQGPGPGALSSWKPVQPLSLIQPSVHLPLLGLGPPLPVRRALAEHAGIPPG